MPENDLLTRAVEKVIPEKLAEEKLSGGKKLRVYLGIDPTGAKLHLGHSVPLRKLKAFADAGHEVIFVVGSFTAMIGDPSGRDAMREPLTKEQVEENFETYKKQASKILDFKKVDIRYNHEWLEKVRFEEILSLASNFTLQQIQQREMYEKRLKEGKPVALHELLYPLMVGYDSVMLDVDFEIGGNDQEFNMLAGRTLQSAFGKRDKAIMTTKIIEGTDGRKMSKTYDNCIFLEDEPKDMYGKLLSIKDDLIATYMECCTDIPMEEIKEATNAMKNGANPKDFKMRLAKEIVTMYHGEKEAVKAEEEFTRVFSNGELPEEMMEIKAKEGSLLIDVLVENELASSKSEARRLIEQGGVTLNDIVIPSHDAKVGEGVLRIGKRKFARLIVK